MIVPISVTLQLDNLLINPKVHCLYGKGISSLLVQLGFTNSYYMKIRFQFGLFEVNNG